MTAEIPNYYHMISKVTGYLYRCLNSFISPHVLIQHNCENIYLYRNQLQWEFKTNIEELETDS